MHVTFQNLKIKKIYMTYFFFCWGGGRDSDSAMNFDKLVVRWVHIDFSEEQAISFMVKGLGQS
jgi:hypothetical protein